MVTFRKNYKFITRYCFIFSFILISFWTTSSLAQNDSINYKSNEQIDDQINQNIEILSEQLQTEDGDLSSLTESWMYYKSHPVNLNKATKDELSDLQILTDIQINNLLRHREKNGYLINIYELQSIDGFDLLSIKKIMPFVYVSDQFNSAFFSTKEMFKDGKHEFVSRIQRITEEQSGYHVSDSVKRIKPNSYYLGSPNRIFARYSFQYNNNVSFVLAGEKDAGEEFKIGGNNIDSIPLKGGLVISNIDKQMVLIFIQVTLPSEILNL